MSVLKEIEASVMQVQNGRRQYVDKMKVDTANAKLELLIGILKIRKEYALNTTEFDSLSTYYSKYFCTILSRSEDVIMRQEVIDINLEISKFNRIMQYLSIIESCDDHHYQNVDVKKIKEKFDKLIVSTERYNDDLDVLYKNDLIKLSEITKKSLNITDTEKKEILQAMGLSRGHWYKCPNGHVYCITECGGAMQVSKCNECGASIGGTSHRLLGTNAVATEMDGARYSAFSEHNNIGNYGNMF